VAVWDELKVALVRLRDEQPGALKAFPAPEVAPAAQDHPAP
jgi:hypothetical protein